MGMQIGYRTQDLTHAFLTSELITTGASHRMRLLRRLNQKINFF